jgi:hypothetical protein
VFIDSYCPVEENSVMIQMKLWFYKAFCHCAHFFFVFEHRIFCHWAQNFLILSTDFLLMSTEFYISQSLIIFLTITSRLYVFSDFFLSFDLIWIKITSEKIQITADKIKITPHETKITLHETKFTLHRKKLATGAVANSYHSSN